MIGFSFDFQMHLILKNIFILIIFFSAVPVSAVSTANVLQAGATIVTTSGGGSTGSPGRHSDEEHLSSSPVNGHSSPQQQSQPLNVKIEKNHLIVTTTNGDSVNNGQPTSGQQPNQSQQTIIVTTGQPGNQNNQLNTQNGQTVLHGAEVHIKTEPITHSAAAIAATVLQQQQQQNDRIKTESMSATTTAVLQHPNEVHIKTEPIDSLPPLASPAQMVDVISANVDHSRELEPSPPATVISLAPAQPYPPNGPTQLTFATPTYDITGNGQYAVQVIYFELKLIFY